MLVSGRIFISIHVIQLALTRGSSLCLSNQLLSFVAVAVEQGEQGLALAQGHLGSTREEQRSMNY